MTSNQTSFKPYYLIFPLLIAAIIFLSQSIIPNLAAQPESGSTFYVATTGTDSGSCGTQGAPCRTIHQAIINSASGDTILVAAGTYTRSGSQGDCVTPGDTAVVCISSTHRTIFGGYTTSNWTSADPTANVTIIDGQNAHRGVQVHGTSASVASLHIEGFTVQNGFKQGATSGADSAIFAFGGGFLADRASITARNLVIKNSQAVGGSTSQSYGGAAAGGGMAFRSNTLGVTLENITFENNIAQGGQGGDRGGFAIGGGLYTFGAVVTGDNLTFTSNQAIAGNTNGSGISGNNNSDAQGGGAAFQVNSDVTLSNITATNNQATGGNAPNGDGGGSFGGAFFAELADVTMTDIYVADNRSDGGDGNNAGDGASLGDGGGIATTRSNITIERGVIVDNVASGGNGTVKTGAGGGGGIYFADYTDTRTMNLTNVIIAGNHAEMGTTGSVVGGGGGGIFINWANAVLNHVTIADNSLGASPMQGIGMVIINGATVDISHSIFSDNTDFAGALAIHAQGGNTVNLDNNLFENNNTDTGGGGVFTGEGSSFTGSPDYVSPGSPNYDYRINSGSAALDQAGTSNTAVDFENQSRSLNGDPDVGADEYNPIIVTVQARDSSLAVSWEGDSDLLPGLDHYEVVVAQSGGASPPNEGPSPIDAGNNTSISLTGVTNNENYTISIDAKNGGDSLIASSNTVTIFPTDDVLFLPLIVR